MYRSLNVVLRCHGRIIRAGASMLVLLSVTYDTYEHGNNIAAAVWVCMAASTDTEAK